MRGLASLRTKRGIRGEKKRDVHRDEPNGHEPTDRPLPSNRWEGKTVDKPAERDDRELDRSVDGWSLIEVESDSRSTGPRRLETGEEVGCPVRDVGQPDGERAAPVR